MNASANYYKVLGLAEDATPAQIKEAYRTHAKAAHPDAGGSAEKMARVNEAYQTLSNPATRREYDESLANPPVEEPTHHTPEHHGTHAHHEPDHDHAEAQAEATRINRERKEWARRSAWDLLRIAGPAAAVMIPATRFIAIQNPDLRIAVGLLAFIPAYATILSVIFLLSPHLRLVFADLMRGFRTTREERMSGLGLVLAAFPLGAIWILIFYA